MDREILRARGAEKRDASSAGRSVAGPRDRALKALSASLNNSPTVQRLEATRPRNRTGLPDNLKAGMEAMSGVALDSVRVHRNSSKPAQLNAHAFAQGTDIHLAPGQERHLSHEAWHVVQQARGQVRPTRQLEGRTPINDDDGLEREADVMGGRAAAAPIQRQVAPPPIRYDGSHGILQLVLISNEQSGGAGDFDTDIAAEVLEFLGLYIEEPDVRKAAHADVLVHIGNALAREDNPYGDKRGEIEAQLEEARSNDVVAAAMSSARPAEFVAHKNARAEEQAVISEGPIGVIKKAELTEDNVITLQNSRGKRVYLFDAEGQPTTSKETAAYMVDTSMGESETENYQYLDWLNLPVPQIYGRATGGYPIVQWIPNQLTVGGGGGFVKLDTKIKAEIKANSGDKFNTDKWKTAKGDIEKLIQAKYSSPDLQFMVDQEGHIYIMDLEPNNTPMFGKAAPALIALKATLEQAIATRGQIGDGSSSSGSSGSND